MSETPMYRGGYDQAVEAYNEAVSQIEILTAENNALKKQVETLTKDDWRRDNALRDEMLEDITKERDEVQKIADNLAAESVDLQKERDELNKNYYELIMAVARKWPNETRHQTALKYIMQAETPSQHTDSAMENPNK